MAWYAARFRADLLTLWLEEPAPELVEVSGAASNMSADSNRLMIAATTQSTSIDHAGPAFSVAVETGEAFSLIALEYQTVSPATVSPRGAELELIQWAELAHAAVTSPTPGVTLDMDASLPATTVSGSFAIPAHGTSGFFEEAHGTLRTTSVESRASGTFGLPTRLDVAPDGLAFEYEAQHVEPTDGSTVMSKYYLWGGTGALAGLVKPGPPVDGPQEGVLPEPVLPAAITIDFGDPISWTMNAVDRADPELGINAFFRNQGSGQPVWRVTAPPGAVQMVLPALPTGADPAEVLGEGALVAQIALCSIEHPEPYTYWCARWSSSRDVHLQR